MEIILSGDWKVGSELPPFGDIEEKLKRDSLIKQITFDTKSITSWDSRLLTFLIKIKNLCISSQIEMVEEGLEKGVQRLLTLASAVPERKGARREGT
jgi:phospholipid/cholesterol/gamma-HCH transport system permease protein